jgi:alpha-1,6-mannosyltransferase
MRPKKVGAWPVIRSGTVEPRERSSNVAVAGFVIGVVAMAVVASVPGSPFHPVLPPGVEPGGPFRWLAGALRIDRLHGASLVTAALGAVLLAVGSFLFLLREAWRGTVSLRTTVILAVAAHAVVLALPLLVSRDVYSYIAYGNIVALHHANPYVQTPASYPGDAVAALVGPKWLATPAVYGPLFTGYASAVVRAVHGLADQVQVFRATALVASLATIGVVATSVRRAWPSRAAFAVAAFGLNPVVLFQSVGSGHNDLLVALAVAAAFAFVLSGRDLLAVVVLALGTTVKATAALPLLLLIVWCVARAPIGRRLRTLATRAGMAALIGAVVAAPFFQLHDPTLGMFELAGHEGWLAPSRFFRRVLDAVSGDTLGVVARVAFAAALVAALAVLARAVWRAAARGDDRGSALELGAAWGWSLLLLMLLGPVLLPWYVVWALPLVWLLTRVPRLVLLGTSVALALSQWTAEPGRFPKAYDLNVLVGHYAITPVVIGLAGWLLWDGWRRWRGGLPLHDAEPVADAAGHERNERRAPASREG